MIVQNKRLGIILLSAMLLLLIPLIAMQFTNEVKWKLADFLVAGILLMGTGSLIDFVLRKVKKASYRIAICACIVAGLLLVWVELAVGII